MITLLLALSAAVAGYTVSVFTWPRLRLAMIGIENEIDDLRAKARVLEAGLRG